MNLDELAATTFPTEWAMACAATGERARRQRHRLRRRARYEADMAPLRAAGRSCAGCSSYVDAPFGAKVKKICDAESDFHGYVAANATGLCPKWSAR